MVYVRWRVLAFSAVALLCLPSCVAEVAPPPPYTAVPYAPVAAYPYAGYPWYYGPEVDIYGGYGRGGYYHGGGGYRGGGFHGGGGRR